MWDGLIWLANISSVDFAAYQPALSCDLMSGVWTSIVHF